MATRRREDYHDDYQDEIISQNIPAGDFIKAKYNESDRNSKIADGYGGGQTPTYNFNYQNKWDKKIEQKRNEYENYAPFNYDYKTDDNYINLANLYSKNARDTSKNAIAQAAAINGGRAGTNAVIAASLGYGQKMSELEGEIPQLRQLAYDMHQRGKDDIRTTMNDYIAQEAIDYGRFSDNYNRMYQNARDLITDKQFADRLALDTKIHTDNLDFSKTQHGDNLALNTKIHDDNYALDTKKHEDNNALAYAELAQNESQFSRTNDRAWAELGWDVESLRTNDAITASLALGYVSKGAAEILGVPEGTPTHEAAIKAGDQLISLAELVGYVSPDVAHSFGYDYSGPTVQTRADENYYGGEPIYSPIPKEKPSVASTSAVGANTESTVENGSDTIVENGVERPMTEGEKLAKSIGMDPTKYEGYYDAYGNIMFKHKSADNLIYNPQTGAHYSYSNSGYKDVYGFNTPSDNSSNNTSQGSGVNYSSTQSSNKSSSNKSSSTSKTNANQTNSYVNKVLSNAGNYDDPYKAISDLVPKEYQEAVKREIAKR